MTKHYDTEDFVDEQPAIVGLFNEHRAERRRYIEAYCDYRARRLPQSTDYARKNALRHAEIARRCVARNPELFQ
jgi:exopolysaccharide biosynthesis predicted pyruvyltransferase EpsI